MSKVLATGALRKMLVSPDEPVRYELPAGEARIGLNELLGSTLHLRHTGTIACVHCARKTRKSFGQGYCFVCFRSLARCDMCIVKPETCHYFSGTCREPEWGEQHCLIGHTVYLANSSGLKVGITRGTQATTRWIDQGATQALPIMQVANRLQSGRVEQLFASRVSDKTQWRRMLAGDPPVLDMTARRDELLAQLQPQLDTLRAEHEEGDLQILRAEPCTIRYPVLEYPEKVVATNFSKHTEVGGRLLGMKGQYLIFDSGVINIRSFAGYEVDVVLQ